MFAPTRASGAPKMFLRHQIEAAASIPKITSSLDANTAQKLLETIVRPNESKAKHSRMDALNHAFIIPIHPANRSYSPSDID
jgi:hypothetical protein